ncbi:UNVERIFIED_CONTAM: hypothetical protein FKN15_056292 [Acipenser sinensis]
MASLWFDSCHHADPWYMGGKITAIDDELQRLTPPEEVTRYPQSVKVRKYWNVNEWRSFFLFYSLPLLRGRLGWMFYVHWSLLVASIYALLQRELSIIELDAVQLHLNSFVELVQPLYGKEHNSYNVHLFLYIPQAVRNWGPMWAWSCFPFESFNHCILGFCHGSKGVPMQIFKNVCLLRDLPFNSSFYFANACHECAVMLHQLFKSFTPRSILAVCTDVECLGHCQEVGISHRLALEVLYNVSLSGLTSEEQKEGGLEDKEELERLRRENKELEVMYKEEKLRRQHPLAAGRLVEQKTGRGRTGQKDRSFATQCSILKQLSWQLGSVESLRKVSRAGEEQPGRQWLRRKPDLDSQGSETHFTPKRGPPAPRKNRTVE